MRVIRIAERRVAATTVAESSRYGVLDSGEVRLLPAGSTLAGILSDLPGLAAAVASGESRALADVELVEPTVGPVSMRDCVGFLQHIRNTRASRGVTEPLPPEWGIRPAFYFANPWSVQSATAPVTIAPGSAAFDYEFEIGAVLGRGGYNLSLDEAHDHIAGYVLYCDWSARDIQTEERAMQIGQGKGKDSALSLGPWVLTADEADEFRTEDGFDFDATVSINDEVVSVSPIRGMDWTFEELVAFASRGSQIHAGDIIASGTVVGGCLLETSGSEEFRGWLLPGDEVCLRGGPLGEIRATIEAGPPVPQWERG